jgi:TPR repeat protein
MPKRVLGVAVFLVTALLFAGVAGAQGTSASFEDLLKQARQGDARAQNRVGEMLAAGNAVQQNDFDAVRWFQKSALQGFVDAQYNLSVMYANGQGVRQDDAETVKWSRLAAKQGHPGAQYQLGLLFAVGAGLEQDYVQAYKWFSLAADRLADMDGETAREDRDLVARKMTAAQIAEAQRLVREWKPEDALPVLAAKDG